MQLLKEKLFTGSMIRAIRRVGAEVNPRVMAETLSLYESLHGAGRGRVTRDVAYGVHERQVCNIFAPTEPEHLSLPVIVFVHGGGFVRGDKEIAPDKIYDNVGWWGVASGFVCVTMNYRLAPEHKWPAGGDDVGNLLDWLAGNVSKYGGNPEQLIVVGHSAGASHVATFLARCDRLRSSKAMIKGAVLCSGLYDIEAMFRAGGVPTAYFGDDESMYAAMSSSNSFARLHIPVLVTVNEFEPRLFQEQGVNLAVQSRAASSNETMRFVLLSGHNHFSCVFNVNLPAHDMLGSHIAAFANSVL